MRRCEIGILVASPRQEPELVLLRVAAAASLAPALDAARTDAVVVLEAG